MSTVTEVNARRILAPASLFVAGGVTAMSWQWVRTAGYMPEVADFRHLFDVDAELVLRAAGILIAVASLLAFCHFALKFAEQRNSKVAQKPIAAGRQAAPAVVMPLEPAQQSQDTVVKQLSQHLDAQLTELVRFVSKYLEANDEQSTALADVQEQLKLAVTVENVVTIINQLVASTTQAQRDAADLKNMLDKAQVQSKELSLQLASAEQLASIDGLTSIANRRRLEEFLSAEVERSHSDFSPLCLIMTDIDHFKKVNDRFGHPTGDSVLKQFSKMLTGRRRATDLVARYGGEEFALVLPKTALGNAAHLAEQLRNDMSGMLWQEAGGRRSIGSITASFGVGEIRDHETPAELIARVDRKLYDAKKNGRNRVEIDSRPAE